METSTSSSSSFAGMRNRNIPSLNSSTSPSPTSTSTAGQTAGDDQPTASSTSNRLHSALLDNTATSDYLCSSSSFSSSFSSSSLDAAETVTSSNSYTHGHYAAMSTSSPSSTTIIPTGLAETVTTSTAELSIAQNELAPSGVPESNSEKASPLSSPQDRASLSESESNAEFSCNICFDTSMSPVLTLCGHLFCWSCLHQWLDSQRQNPTCPVCKAGCAQDKVIPIYGRGKEQLDPRSATPKRPAGQRPEPLRSAGHGGFMLTAGQVSFTGTMIPPFMFTPFGIHYGATYSGTLGANGAVQTPMQAYVSRMFFMLGTLILVGILLY